MEEVRWFQLLLTLVVTLQLTLSSAAGMRPPCQWSQAATAGRRELPVQIC